MRELLTVHALATLLDIDPTLGGLKDLIYKGLHNIYFIALAGGILYAGLIKRRMSLVGEVLGLGIVVGLVLWTPDIVPAIADKIRQALGG
ncbi:MAG: hypothetical protein M3024_08755 [Candidatus Dormibacteraeota bacterium]|nr:hypothetical protein [Candidatus Dormibacteraeota bacterium]